VIVTTIRLWLQRRVLRTRPVSRSRSLNHRRIGVLGLVVVVFAAGGITVALASDPPAVAHGNHSAGTHPPDPAALAAAQAARSQAAIWIAKQVSHGVVVGCDPLMCATLEQDGFPVANLDELGASAADPLGSGVIADSAALRSQIGSRLATVYAPLVIASFGSGQSLIQVRDTAPGGAAAYLAQAHADLLSRQVGGRALLHNTYLLLTNAARADLAAGQVDARLLNTLVALAHRLPVHVRQFADGGPGAAAGTPLRSVEIAIGIKVGDHTRASYLRRVLTFLRAQRSPWRARVAVHRARRRPVLWIEFTAPSPLGLLGANTQN
jgi:hypothetical protein